MVTKKIDTSKVYPLHPVKENMASLQRKVEVQRQEITRLLEINVQRKAAIRELCKIRDEARDLLNYTKGLEAFVPKAGRYIYFPLLEEKLLGWHKKDEAKAPFGSNDKDAS